MLNEDKPVRESYNDYGREHSLLKMNVPDSSLSIRILNPWAILSKKGSYKSYKHFMAICIPKRISCYRVRIHIVEWADIYNTVRSIYIHHLYLSNQLFTLALYEISVLGWIEETVVPMVDGIVQSIVDAHDNLQEGTITISQGELLHSNINRSPQSYLLNPKEERDQYQYNVDKIMTVLGFKSKLGHNVGLVSWCVVRERERIK